MTQDFLDMLLAGGKADTDCETTPDRADTASATHLIRAVAFECLLNHVVDERAQSVLRLVGFDGDFACCAVAGRPSETEHASSETIRHAIAGIGGAEPLIGMRGETLVALFRLQGATNPDLTCTAIAGAFASDVPLCLGPVRRGIIGASRTIHAALTTLRTLPALHAIIETTPSSRVQHQPLLRAEDALPERALLGDEDARHELVDGIYANLLGQGEDDPTMLTVSSFLESGRSLEITARMLNVHPNTVRYRLKRMADTTGWDATNPRDATVLTTAIALGRIAYAEQR